MDTAKIKEIAEVHKNGTKGLMAEAMLELDERLKAVESGDKGLMAEANEEKAALIEEAVKLGIGPESTLSRWGVKRLTEEIAAKLKEQA